MTGVSKSHALAIGHRLGQYEIIDVLAVDAVGIEYAALDRDVGKPVTVGEYFPQGLASRQQGGQVRPESATAFDLGLRGFLAQARSLAPIHHPNLIQVRAHLRANDTGYVVTDPCEGTLLAEQVESRGTLPEKELLSILHPVLDALQEMHQAGLVHGRLWPDGIIIRKDGSPLLAGHRATGQAPAPTWHDSGAMPPLAGGRAPGYAALEEYSHAAEIGPWTDIYALGAIAYRCVTGSAPPDAPGRVLLEGDLRAELAGARSCTPRTLAAIEAALAVRVVNRPVSVADWRTMLVSAPPARKLTARSSARGRPSPLAGRPSAGAFQPPATRLPSPARPDAPTVRRRGARMSDQPLAERRKRRWAAPAASLVAVVSVLTWVDTGLLRAPADHPGAPSSGTPPGAASSAAEFVAQPYGPLPARLHAAPDSLTLELMPPDAEVRFVENTLPYSPGMRLPAGSHRLLVTRAGYVPESRTVHVDGDTRHRITLVSRSDPAR